MRFIHCLFPYFQGIKYWLCYMLGSQDASASVVIISIAVSFGVVIVLITAGGLMILFWCCHKRGTIIKQTVYT